MSEDTFLTYATRDGQARRIAERIRDRLGDAVTLCDLKQTRPTDDELSRAKLLIVVAAVRYGKHLPETDEMLSAYAKLPGRPPLALASVNLTARKPGKTSAEGNAYLRKLIAQYRLAPVLAVAFAGRLDYARYRWFDRHLIRLIMWLTGGPTDLATCIEYTDWQSVDDFAEKTRLFREHSLIAP